MLFSISVWFSTFISGAFNWDILEIATLEVLMSIDTYFVIAHFHLVIAEYQHFMDCLAGVLPLVP